VNSQTPATGSFDGYGYANVVGTGRTGATQWLNEEQSKTLLQDKLADVETELTNTLIYLIRRANRLDIDLLKEAENKVDINEKNIL